MANNYGFKTGQGIPELEKKPVKVDKTKWVVIEPKGKPAGDNYFGYPNKAKLEETLAEVQSHIGEKVIVGGGGGAGANYATLKGAHIEPFPIRIHDVVQDRWGLKVDLRMLKGDKIFGKQDFDPWLDSWYIEVKEHPVKKQKAVKAVKIADVVTASEASQAGEELSEYGHQKKAKYKVTSGKGKGKGSRKSQHTSTGLGSVR